MTCSLLAALFGFLAALTAAWISHAAKISEFRHIWINGLRDDIAIYFQDLEALHFYVDKFGQSDNAGTFAKLEQDKHESRNKLLLSYNRILLRLNAKEELHKQFADALGDFLIVGQRVPDQQKVQSALALARELLKQEWEVTKQFPLSRWINRLTAWYQHAKAACAP